MGETRQERICVCSIILAFVYVVVANKNTEKGRKLQKTPYEKTILDASSFAFAHFLL